MSREGIRDAQYMTFSNFVIDVILWRNFDNPWRKLTVIDHEIFCSGRAPSPCAAPRGSSESSRGLACHASPYQPGARREPPVRRRHPTVGAPAEVAALRLHLRRHRDVTGGDSPIKTDCHTLLVPSPPLHRACHCRPPVNSRPRPCPVRLTFLTYSLGALETCAATRCSSLHLPHRSCSPPRPPPPVIAARPRRSRPCSNPGLPHTLSEHVVVTHRLPGRERGRLTGIRPAPPPPMPKAPIARPLSF
jgi:hypothetical protein